jgi:hypothetical protein
MNQRNIHTQATDIPANIDGETPPSEATLRAYGWRIEPPIPPIAEGYTRTSTRPDGAPGLLIEGDGVTGEWEVVDVLTADIEAAQAAENKAANIARWILENAFLMVCQQYFGDLTKRGTKELLAKAFELVDADQKAAMLAFGVVIGLDKELTRIAGSMWWDSCEWHNDPDAIGGAAAYLGVEPA